MKWLFSFLLFFSLCFLATGVTAQELYRWVDEKGAVHFTDSLHSVPEKYRDKVERRKLSFRREATGVSVTA